MQNFKQFIVQEKEIIKNNINN